jgi:hypothetical protein
VGRLIIKFNFWLTHRVLKNKIPNFWDLPGINIVIKSVNLAIIIYLILWEQEPSGIYKGLILAIIGLRTDQYWKVLSRLLSWKIYIIFIHFI